MKYKTGSYLFESMLSDSRRKAKNNKEKAQILTIQAKFLAGRSKEILGRLKHLTK